MSRGIGAKDRVVVAVGSKNPAKVSAVEEVFKEVFGAEVEVLGFSVDTVVSKQPLNEETVVGAHNRAKRAFEVGDADYGVGIEGGLVELGGRWYSLGFVAIIDRSGEVGTGASGWFECPKIVLDEIWKGRELADVMDEVSGTRDSRSELGAIGILTKNRVTRKDLYAHGVYMALVPFINRELWRPSKQHEPSKGSRSNYCPGPS